MGLYERDSALAPEALERTRAKLPRRKTMTLTRTLEFTVPDYMPASLPVEPRGSVMAFVRAALVLGGAGARPAAAAHARSVGASQRPTPLTSEGEVVKEKGEEAWRGGGRGRGRGNPAR